MHALSFAAGVYLLQQQAQLPALVWPLTASVLLLVPVMMSARFCRCRELGGWHSGLRLVQRCACCVLALVLGFAWANARAQWRLADELRPHLEGIDLSLSGQIRGLPRQFEDGSQRFLFEPDKDVDGVPQLLQLSWYRRSRSMVALPRLQAGQRWRLEVRLRRPRSFANPFGFDYEARLLEEGIRATGYVRQAELQAGAAGGQLSDQLHRLRGRIRERFRSVLNEAPHAGVLIALVIGEQGEIPAPQWEVFRRTGVAHLVAISGMHISLVAGLAGLLAGACWRLMPWLMLRSPRRQVQALSALSAAGLYALLAGLGIPVQRALIMLGVLVFVLLSRRTVKPSAVLALALVLVLLFDPWACLAAGFWLSFGAVAAITLLLAGRQAAAPGWRVAVRVQLGITLALAPLLLLMFNALPLLSPLANAVAIPMVNFAIAPLALSGALLPFDFLLQWAHLLSGWMMQVLEYLAAIELAFWRQGALPWWLALLSLGAAFALVLPTGTPGRKAAVLVLVLMLCWPAPRPRTGAFSVRVLDVGQGLAVHVQTATHDLLYDAGPPYGPHSDAGKRVIQPYLQASGVRKLDALVLSHDDSDHVGGAVSLAAAMPISQLWAPSSSVRAAQTGHQPVSCQSGRSWQWDGVEFEFLHPAADQVVSNVRRAGNNQSCVLRVANAAGSALLLGDVETMGERQLLARSNSERLSSDVVVSAHHGSRSSSSPALVLATLPEAVIHSAAYRNRFGHPHPEVWARWAAAGARNWRTDSQGAIEARFDARAGTPVKLRSERERRPRYWHNR